MENRWDNVHAHNLTTPLQMRVYSSRLLGKEEDLVLHGGGNTSVKATVNTLFGKEEILYVKGSGWNLATIEAQGFAPVRLQRLLEMAELDALSDSDMVKYQRSAMIDPSAPNPSVEAILHAVIPHSYVDHTHADAVVTVSNTSDGQKRLQEIYGDSVLVLPYVMPGFNLAKQVYTQVQSMNREQLDALDGIVLMHHGVFTFDNSAQASYSKMIDIVSRAETYLHRNTSEFPSCYQYQRVSREKISILRKEVSNVRGTPVIVTSEHKREVNKSWSILKHSSQKGTLTPDHVIRIKPFPMTLENIDSAVEEFMNTYQHYFESFTTGRETQLDKAPRYALSPSGKVLTFGTTLKESKIIRDIANHNIRAMLRAESMDAWNPVQLSELFELEYWELEQAKLKRGAQTKPMQGKIALVTGAASGIGSATVDALVEQGAVVAAVDIKTITAHDNVASIQTDLRNENGIERAISTTIDKYGGLDMVVSNVGMFPPTTPIEDMKSTRWNDSLNLNLTSHMALLQQSVPYLKNGIDPAVVIVGSKNVPAPGPGASAYSVAKAGLTQLGRIAAMEFGKYGIPVNMIHPNQVFDTGIWTEEKIAERAQSYGLTPEEYKTNNMLKTEITSRDVADLIVTMLSPVFSKTTGAQVPIDGGNDRVI